MAITETFKNWIQKAEQIGFTNNQVNGLALLCQWRFAYSEPIDGQAPNMETFTDFISPELFTNIYSRFNSDDFFAAVPVLREAGRALNIKLPEKRVDVDGLPTVLFDHGGNSDDKWANTLGPRHEFDLWLLDELGKLLDEKSTPADYFVFGDYLTQLGHKHDWEGFRRIQIAIVLRPSPLLMSFTNPTVASDIQNLEPIEIALQFLNYGKKSVAEITWYASKTYMFDQKSPFPRINYDLEFQDATQFLKTIVHLITPYIATQLAQNPSLADEIDDEYKCESAELPDIWATAETLIEKKFSILKYSLWNRPSTLLVNAVIHNEMCHLIMKNINVWHVNNDGQRSK